MIGFRNMTEFELSTKTQTSIVTQFDSSTTERKFASYVDNFKGEKNRSGEVLLKLLPESHPLYRQRPVMQMMRMRAYIISAFYYTGIPKGALIYILDILENSFHPYSVAAAARTLRVLPDPNPELSTYLMKAIYNIWKLDQPITFESYEPKWPLKDYTTAMQEILTSLAWMGAKAQGYLENLNALYDELRDQLNSDVSAKLVSCINQIKSAPPETVSCCMKPLLSDEEGDENTTPNIDETELQDQDNNFIRWGEFFLGRPSIIAFFYASCTNPRKCTQTIYNIAEIQDLLENEKLADSVNLAAITYTPELDTPASMKLFGKHRGLNFGERCKMLRCTGDMVSLSRAFKLEVNYIDTTVNQHRIEFFLLNKNGELVKSVLRLKTDSHQIISGIYQIL